MKRAIGQTILTLIAILLIPLIFYDRVTMSISRFISRWKNTEYGLRW